MRFDPRCANGCYHAPPRNITKAHPGSIIRKTWSTPLERVLKAEDPEYQWLHTIADSAAPDVRQRFLDAVAAIRGTVQEAQLRAAIESGDMERVLHILGLDQDASQFHEAIIPPLRETVHATAAAALEATPAIELAQRHLRAEARMRFDIVNPHTVHAVQHYGFNLIRQVNDETRNGIRAIVSHAMEFGGHPYEQARQIKNLIGLTERQARAVTNFRRLLSAGDSEALTRELRDHRFDAQIRTAIRSGNGLTKEQIDQQAQRYADRMLQWRARNIARTETINAARIGTQAAWHQAAEKGLLRHNRIRQGWGVTPDDRLCEFCVQVPEMNPDGVPLGGQFETPFGPVDGPTLHPECRCIVYLMSF